MFVLISAGSIQVSFYILGSLLLFLLQLTIQLIDAGIGIPYGNIRPAPGAIVVLAQAVGACCGAHPRICKHTCKTVGTSRACSLLQIRPFARTEQCNMDA